MTQQQQQQQQQRRRRVTMRVIHGQLSRLTGNPSVWGDDEWESSLKSVIKLRDEDLLATGSLFPSSSCGGGSEEKEGTNSPMEHLQELLFHMEPRKQSFRFDNIKDSNKGNGVLATQVIQKGEVIMKISSENIIEANLLASKRWIPYKGDTLLQKMPSVLLALKLLAEATGSADSTNCNSIRASYIQSLPTIQTLPRLPLWYALEDFRALHGTTAFPKALALLYHSIKQYCYLYQLLYSNGSISGASPPPIEETSFTLTNFLWATSMVTSRQNQGPPKNNNTQPSSYVLIPGWDLINHESGSMTSEWIQQEDGTVHLQFRAMRQYENGEEITMCYGKRTNLEFLVYSGFVPDGKNTYDKTTLELLMNLDVSSAVAAAGVDKTAIMEERVQLVRQLFGIRSELRANGLLLRNLAVLPDGNLDGLGFQAVLLVAMSAKELDLYLVQLQEMQAATAEEQATMIRKLLLSSVTSKTIGIAKEATRNACQSALDKLVLAKTTTAANASIARFVASEQTTMEACMLQYT